MAHNIWDNSVPDLKGNITRKKPIPVVCDMVQVTEDLVKLHKDIYFTSEIYFVNVVSFFLNLIRKICFISVNHLSNKKIGGHIQDLQRNV